jgi:Tfp pilus assembly protein PilN
MKRVIFSLFAFFLTLSSLTIKAQEVVQNNIKPINNALELVSKLEPISFNYDKVWAEKLKLSSNLLYGFDGASAKANVPSLVKAQSKDYSAGKNAYKSATLTKVDYESLIPLLVGSIKEQQQQIDQLKKEIKSLKAQASK